MPLTITYGEYSLLLVLKNINKNNMNFYKQITKQNKNATTMILSFFLCENNPYRLNQVKCGGENKVVARQLLFVKKEIINQIPTF